MFLFEVHAVDFNFFLSLLLSACDECPGGYFCPEGTKEATANPCPFATYCPPGSKTPKDCPAGRIGVRDRVSRLEDCPLCPANFYSDKPRATVRSALLASKTFFSLRLSPMLASGKNLSYTELENKRLKANSITDLFEQRCGTSDL